ncbi:MAG: hypothetical protein QG602_1613, partial [Verrucomicrobiota bacterium]|nr:hypothetical protein [Verrucomicrobiota bacterium]
AGQVSAAANVGSGGGAGRGIPRASGGTGTARPPRKAGPDPLDKAIRAANVGEAGRAGLAAGSQAINAATAALGPLASKADIAKAKIADLTAQVERNRKEMADLKRQTIETGDSEGKLAARSAGLAAANKDVAISLTQAKRGLSEVRGGLIDNIKAAADLSARFGVLKVAAGNMLSSAVQGIGGKVIDGLKGATGAAVDFESSLVGISKVARGTDDTAEGFARIKDGIKATSKELGVLPTEVSDLTAQLAPAFSGVKEGASDTAVDIVALANDVTKIGVAWDITGKEAGKSFAEISSGLQLTTDQTKSLFGGINEIGNQLGVNAATLAESVQRSAGVLKGANISGETGAALNAVLIKTGSSAEVAATGVRTFIGRLGAGETKGQLKAFKALNIDMVELRKNMANGGAEQEIKKVVDALAGLKNEERLGVLAEMFGTESIGSIGAAATATDLLATSMQIMGDKTAATTSVQKEFDRVQQTSKAKIAALKANIEVLAIEFGERLLPYINKLVEFLTSKEGQEWGAKAVEKAVAVVTGLADALGFVGGIISGLIETFGGLGIAVAGVGIAAAGMVGPFGMALAAGVAAGAGIAAAFMEAKRAMFGMSAEDLQRELLNKAADIRHAEHEAEMKAANESLAADQAGQDAHTKNRARAEELAKQYEDAELARMGKNASEADKLAAFRKSRQLASAVEGNSRLLGGGTEEDRLAALEKYVAEKVGPAKSSAPEKAKRGGGGHGGGGHGHKATKMDKALATLDPSLSGILTRGGETDEGGDFKVADNVLDRAVFGRVTKGRGGGESASIGPGPNITNDNRVTNITTNVNQVFPAERGMDGRVAAAGRAGGERAAMAVNSTAKQAVNAGGTIR